LTPPGIAPVPWITLAGRQADDLLPELAQQHALPGRLGISRGNADDIAPANLAVETEEQIGRREVEEMQRVRLQDLAIVHQAAHLLRS
jgi:hypothetical protein